MPTAYTYPVIDKNQSFEGFVWHCAQAFFHDPPTPLPLTKRWSHETSCAWHHQMLDREQTRLQKLRTMSETEWSEEREADNRESLARHEESKKQKEKDNELLRNMRANVEMWVPPTPDHEPLKKYMLEQISISMERFYDPPTPNTSSLVEEIARVEKSVEEYVIRIKEEEKFTEERYGWIQALHKQIPQPPAKEILGR